MATILVTGVGGPAGRSATALLLERGHTVVGADMREAALPESTFRLVPPARHPAFLRTLRDLALSERVDLVIPTVTEELPIVAAGRARWGEIPVLIGPLRAVRMANDKYLTCERLARCGVSVPRYALPSQFDSAEEIAGLVGWPCLSKPRVSRGGREVAVRAADDWLALVTLDDRSIVQEFIPGADYAPNVCIGQDGAATVVVLEKTRLKEGVVGNAAAVRRVSAPDVAELAVSAARALGLTGPLDIDIRRRADGTPAVLEINARFGANIAYAPEVLDAALAAVGVA